MPSAAQVLWTRGGSAPEVSQVTFELSVNGGAAWTSLGNGTRVGTTANWQLSGLSLSNGGQVRARGRTTGGYHNGSAGLVESVATESPAESKTSTQMSWRGVAELLVTVPEIEPAGANSASMFEVSAPAVTAT